MCTAPPATRWPRSGEWIWSSSRVRWWRCSAPPARGRPPCCGTWPACSSPPRERSRSAGGRSPGSAAGRSPACGCARSACCCRIQRATCCRASRRRETCSSPRRRPGAAAGSSAAGPPTCWIAWAWRARRTGLLSGGEQQRLAVAVALANGPRLLLADEPTSQLDPESAGDVIELIQAANASLGTTVVAVTHDPEVAAALGRTITIRDGRVGAAGHGGREFMVVGKDGTVTLPPDLLDEFPPGSLATASRADGGVLLRRVDPGTIGAEEET